MLLLDLLGDVENDRLLIADRGEMGRLLVAFVLVEIGDSDLILSKHLTSVSKCSTRSSLLTAMLQMGQITSPSLEDINRLALKLKSSAFSSRRRFSAAATAANVVLSGGLLVDTGGTRNGLGNGNPGRLVAGGNGENGESTRVVLGIVEARDSQAWCSIGNNCGLGKLVSPGNILLDAFCNFTKRQIV